MPRELATWLESKPGPFVGRTPESVWRQAWKNFNEGETGRIDGLLDFMIRLGDAGFDVRAFAIGGYALDKVT